MSHYKPLLRLHNMNPLGLSVGIKIVAFEGTITVQTNRPEQSSPCSFAKAKAQVLYRVTSAFCFEHQLHLNSILAHAAMNETDAKWRICSRT